MRKYNMETMALMIWDWHGTCVCLYCSLKVGSVVSQEPERRGAAQQDV